jgi:hypothetical protein
MEKTKMKVINEKQVEAKTGSILDFSKSSKGLNTAKKMNMKMGTPIDKSHRNCTVYWIKLGLFRILNIRIKLTIFLGIDK